MALVIFVLKMLMFFSVTTASDQSLKQVFDEFQRLHPQDIFTAHIDGKIKNTLAAYATREQLPNGQRYGASVRGYHLRNKSLSAVRSEMKKMNCDFQETVIKNPEDNKPKIFEGHTTPLWVFLCSDGGVIRIKPQGDPAGKFSKVPQGIKALRYPYNSKFENYSDEVVKVDDEGNAIPKTKSDLGPKHLIDAWGQDAHMDLKR